MKKSGIQEELPSSFGESIVQLAGAYGSTDRGRLFASSLCDEMPSRPATVQSGARWHAMAQDGTRWRKCHVQEADSEGSGQLNVNELLLLACPSVPTSEKARSIHPPGSGMTAYGCF